MIQKKNLSWLCGISISPIFLNKTSIHTSSVNQILFLLSLECINDTSQINVLVVKLTENQSRLFFTDSSRIFFWHGMIAIGLECFA